MSDAPTLAEVNDAARILKRHGHRVVRLPNGYWQIGLEPKISAGMLISKAAALPAEADPAPSDPAAYRDHLASLGVALRLTADAPDEPGSIFGAKGAELLTVDIMGTMGDEDAGRLAKLVAELINRAAGAQP